MQEGGLQDEGGTVDKESGNDVPSGSLKKEVRDDVPAMLSEGEFVIPADVVRYIGLSKLIQMRQEAKMGLQMMEKMGQMGNSEEAEIPDDLPFGVTDIVVMGSDDDDDDEKEMAQGGIIYAQEGTDVSAPFMNNPPISSNPPREPKEGFEWFATRSGWIERPIEVDKRGNPKPRLLGIDFELVDGVWVKSGAILPDNMDKYTPQPKPEKDYTRSKEPVAPQPTSEKNYYTDEYGMPMMKLPPQQPQQTDFERMMGYEAGRGDNPYAPSRVAYQNKKGEVVYKLEDYMGRPMESTTGLTRVTPYGPEGDQPTPAPSPDPTPDDGQSAIEARREEKRKERRQAEKAELRKEQAKQAMETSAKRLGMSASVYAALPMSARMSLAAEEINVMRGKELNESAVSNILKDVDKGEYSNSKLENVLGGIKDFLGIESNDGAVFSSSPPSANPFVPQAGADMSNVKVESPIGKGFEEQDFALQSALNNVPKQDIITTDIGQAVDRDTNEFSGTGVRNEYMDDDEGFDSASYVANQKSTTVPSVTKGSIAKAYDADRRKEKRKEKRRAEKDKGRSSEEKSRNKAADKVTDEKYKKIVKRGGGFKKGGLMKKDYP